MSLRNVRCSPFAARKQPAMWPVAGKQHPLERDPNAECFVKCGRADDGRLLAICYAKAGDDIVVLDVEVVADSAAALKWYETVRVTKPWIDRS